MAIAFFSKKGTSGMLFECALPYRSLLIAVIRTFQSLPFAALAHRAGHPWVAGHARAAPVAVVARERAAKLAGRYWGQGFQVQWGYSSR